MNRSRTVIAAIGVLCVTAAALAQDRPPARQPPGAVQELHIDDEAPQFTLKSLDGKEEFDLAKARAERPVILFFGSYT